MRMRVTPRGRSLCAGPRVDYVDQDLGRGAVDLAPAGGGRHQRGGGAAADGGSAALLLQGVHLVGRLLDLSRNADGDSTQLIEYLCGLAGLFLAREIGSTRSLTAPSRKTSPPVT
jgi:hypothetical protein